VNPYLIVAVTLVAYLVASTTLARLGYGVRVYLAVKRPRRNPRMPDPRPGCLVMALQVRRDHEQMLRDGVVGIVKLEPVGDGTVTLTVEQTQPQAS